MYPSINGFKRPFFTWDGKKFVDRRVRIARIAGVKMRERHHPSTSLRFVAAVQEPDRAEGHGDV